MRALTRSVCSLAFLATLGHSAFAQRADTAQLHRTLDELLRSHHGTVGIAVRNLATNEQLSIRGDETFPTQSLIKVSILVALMDEVKNGRVRLDERSTMIDRDKVGGTGEIHYLSSGDSFTMADLAWLMITLSDNTATNLLLDKLDARTVGMKMESLGLPHSKVFAKTFRRETSIAPDSSKKYGLGVTTPNEMVELFALLYQGKAASPSLDSLSIKMLLANQDDRMMTRWLPENVRVAHKTGTGDVTRTDCGIIYAPSAPLALCVLTTDNEDKSYAVDNAAHLIIARTAREVFHFYNPAVALPAMPLRP